MEEKKIVKKGYILLSIILIGIPSLLLILPNKTTSTELEPELLLAEIVNDNRFVSTDYVADRIICADPHIVLIDVRSPDEFAKFSLKNAVNIPLENLFDKDEDGDLIWESILNQDVNKNIFYSNGTVYANQAWMLTRRMDFKNNYVMEGGLNKWVETIMRPIKPESTASDEEFALYTFRTAAAAFFGKGGTSNSSSSGDNTPQTTIPPVKKEKKEKKQGGC
jgi:rhodanese-related sulfurtransferase